MSGLQASCSLALLASWNQPGSRFTGSVSTYIVVFWAARRRSSSLTILSGRTYCGWRARHRHGDAFGHARAHDVPRGGATQVVEQFVEDPRGLARSSPGLLGRVFHRDGEPVGDFATATCGPARPSPERPVGLRGSRSYRPREESGGPQLTAQARPWSATSNRGGLTLRAADPCLLGDSFSEVDVGGCLSQIFWRTAISSNILELELRALVDHVGL
jgi:hypothetical protein